MGQGWMGIVVYGVHIISGIWTVNHYFAISVGYSV